MKKVFVGFISFFVFATIASAGMLMDGTFLAEPIPQGKFEVNADASYSTASDFLAITGSLSPSVEAKWQSLSDAGLDSITYLNVPVRFSYGLLDSLSFRLTLPYASFNTKPTAEAETRGSGLANIELEGLCKFIAESENNPSFSALLNLKMGAGKKLAELATGEMQVGSRSTDITLAGVLGKKLGPATGKLLVGYVLTNSYKENIGGGAIYDFDLDLTDQIIYSLAVFYPVTDQLEVASELWGATSLGKEKWSFSGTSIELDNSQRGVLVFSPLISYKVGDKLIVRGTADMIVSKPAAVTLNFPDWMKYTTYTIGATYTL